MRTTGLAPPFAAAFPLTRHNPPQRDRPVYPKAVGTHRARSCRSLPRVLPACPSWPPRRLCTYAGNASAAAPFPAAALPAFPAPRVSAHGFVRVQSLVPPSSLPEPFTSRRANLSFAAGHSGNAQPCGSAAGHAPREHRSDERGSKRDAASRPQPAHEDGVAHLHAQKLACVVASQTPTSTSDEDSISVSYDATSHDTLSRSSSACGRDEIPSSEPVVKARGTGTVLRHERRTFQRHGRRIPIHRPPICLRRALGHHLRSSVCPCPLPRVGRRILGRRARRRATGQRALLPVEATEWLQRPIASMLPPTRN